MANIFSDTDINNYFEKLPFDLSIARISVENYHNDINQMILSKLEKFIPNIKEIHVSHFNKFFLLVFRNHFLYHFVYHLRIF